MNTPRSCKLLGLSRASQPQYTQAQSFFKLQLRPCSFLALVSFQTPCRVLHTRMLLRTNEPSCDAKQTLTLQSSPANRPIVMSGFGVVTRLARLDSMHTYHLLGGLTACSMVSEGTGELQPSLTPLGGSLLPITNRRVSNYAGP